MKKFSKVLIFSAVMVLPIGLSAEDDAPSKVKAADSELVRCTIDVQGFYASGRCRAVLRAYRRWKEIER